MLRHLFALLLITTPAFALADTPAKPTAHQQQDIEGWQVRVDQRLLEGDQAPLGGRALKLLRNRLEAIEMALPADKVEVLRKVPIQLDLTHGGLHLMQYHPSVEWLKQNGYDANLWRTVHIPDAADFASPSHHSTQPWCLLHEFAHSYHDQVIGFERTDIKDAWKAFHDSGKYAKIRNINGATGPHYALTDQKEFFAEMTETYFGMNDFFPYNRDELRQAEPVIYELMRKCWGELP